MREEDRKGRKKEWMKGMTSEEKRREDRVWMNEWMNEC